METLVAARAFAALGHPVRLDILLALAPSGATGLPAGEIGTLLGLPAATLSFHLKELTQSMLLTPSRRGRRIFYAADTSSIDRLGSYLLRGRLESRDDSEGSFDRTVHESVELAVPKPTIRPKLAGA